eukprot:4131872-Prorocentrum_lima.AAC.1
MAQPVPENTFAETHTWIKGQVKGSIALFVDDMIQAGARASNVELLKALGKKWTMSSPEHLGPRDRHDKLKFTGVMRSRQPHKTNGKEECTYF